MHDTHQNIETEQLQDFLIAVRRDLHKYPESGWCEFRTTSVIAGYLHILVPKQSNFPLLL